MNSFANSISTGDGAVLTRTLHRLSSESSSYRRMQVSRGKALDFEARPGLDPETECEFQAHGLSLEAYPFHHPQGIPFRIAPEGNAEQITTVRAGPFDFAQEHLVEALDSTGLRFDGLNANGLNQWFPSWRLRISGNKGWEKNI